MAISRDAVVHVARLARLALTEEELDRFAGQAVRRLGGRPPELPYRCRDLPLGRKIASVVGRVDYVRVQVGADGTVEPLAVSGA